MLVEKLWLTRVQLLLDETLEEDSRLKPAAVPAQATTRLSPDRVMANRGMEVSNSVIWVDHVRVPEAYICSHG